MIDEINPKDLEKFRKLGLIDEIALRNYYIRKDFEKLKESGVKIRTIFDLLSDKHNLSTSSINLIIYKKNY